MDAIANTLMIDGQLQWNLEFIQLITFQPDDARIISNIPLSVIDREYKLVWAYNSNGIHSMQSAYHLHYTWMIRSQWKYSMGEEQHRCGEVYGA